MLQILRITEGAVFTDYCVMGFKICGEGTFCPMHEKWMPMKLGIINMFKQLNLAALAEDVRRGKYPLVDLPHALFSSAPQL